MENNVSLKTLREQAGKISEKASLNKLRKQVAIAEQQEKDRQERKALKTRLFKAQNPALTAFGRGTKITAKAFGRGVKVVGKGLQTFSENVAKNQASARRATRTPKAFKKKRKSSLFQRVPIQKGGRIVAFEEVPVRGAKKRKKKRRASRSFDEGFSFDPIGSFDTGF
jgi:hypothetical protein